MTTRRCPYIRLALSCAFALSAVLAHAVTDPRASNYGGGSQLWFQAEDYDERNPDTDEFFVVVDAPDAFGQVLTREGGAGGMMRWSFDISLAGGSAGTWFFYGRVINPSNQSDYLLVEADPDDPIPSGPPFPGENEVPPFNNDHHRIFEQDTPDWGWAHDAHAQGHTKDLGDGVNNMYMYHRQGNNTRLMDVFVWADSPDYVPSDADFEGAEQVTPVEPAGKAAVTWASMKARRL